MFCNAYFIVFFIFLRIDICRMMRTFIIQFSDRDETRRMRFKVTDDSTANEVEKEIRNELYDIKCREVQIYDSVFDRFRCMSDIDKFPLEKVLRVYVDVHNPAQFETLLIKGRSFEVNDGIEINGRILRISEQSNHSEGTGLNTWDGSVVLAKYFEKCSLIQKCNKVLELGSGTGVSGIATHFLGAQLTVLTDLEYVIDNLRKSVNLNVGENTSSHDTASSIHVRTLDWCDINTYIFPNEFTCQNISEFVGDDNSERGTTIDNYDTRSMDQGEISTTTQWDIIIGADIIWLEHLVEPLVKVLSHLCTTSHTVIYLAHQTRSSRVDSLLFDLLQSNSFVVSMVDRKDLDQNYSTPVINVYKITRNI